MGTGEVIKIKIKNYLLNYTIIPFSLEQRKQFIDFEIKQKEKGSKENFHPTSKRYLFRTLFLTNIKKQRNDDGTISEEGYGEYEYYLPTFGHSFPNSGGSELKIHLINNEELLNDIAKGVKDVFMKKEKRENYTLTIKRILESKEKIDHLELFENLNEYLQLFGNKEELDKLNNKYKGQLGIQIIKNNLIEIINILKQILKNIKDEDINLKNLLKYNY